MCRSSSYAVGTGCMAVQIRIVSVQIHRNLQRVMRSVIQNFIKNITIK